MPIDDLVARILIFAIVGLVSGFISGLLGIGGGTVRIPIFFYLLPLIGVAHSVVMHVATATSLALMIPSAISSTRRQHALGNLDLSFYKTWAVGIFIGVLIGVILLPAASTEVLQSIFAVYVLIVGLYTLAGHGLLVLGRDAPQGATKLGWAAVIGLVASLTGTGGGTLTTPLLEAYGVRLVSAIAIASATGLVTGTVATIGAIITGWRAPNLPPYTFGYVDGSIFIAMLPTVFLSAPLGVNVGYRMSETMLRRTYAVLLILVGIYLLLNLVL